MARAATVLLTLAATVLAAPSPRPAPPAASSDAWLKAVEAVSAKVESAKLLKAHLLMTIEESAPMNAVVAAPEPGINLEILRESPGTFAIGGYLKTHARLRDGRRSLSGVEIFGGGVNVSVTPAADGLYLLHGIYASEDGRDKTIDALIAFAGRPLRDLTIRQKGLDLHARWRADGYTVQGAYDPAAYGKRELAIIGGAVSTLTFDLFRL